MVRVAHDERFNNCPSCTERQKRLYNCEGQYGGRKLKIGKMEMYECPVPQITNRSRILYKYANHYKTGFLPWPGGISDQPFHIMRSIEIINGEEAEIQHEEIEESKRKQKQPQIQVKRKRG